MPNSLVRLYATFHLTFFDPVKRSRIDVATFLESSGPEGSIDQDIQVAIVRSSGSFADCPAQLRYQCVSGIEIAHALVPGEEVFQYCGCFQQIITKRTRSGPGKVSAAIDCHLLKRHIQIHLRCELPQLLNKWPIFAQTDLAMDTST